MGPDSSVNFWKDSNSVSRLGFSESDERSGWQIIDWKLIAATQPSLERSQNHSASHSPQKNPADSSLRFLNSYWIGRLVSGSDNKDYDFGKGLTHKMMVNPGCGFQSVITKHT